MGKGKKERSKNNRMKKETREPIKRAHTGKKYIRQTHKVTGISEPLTVDVSMTRDNCIQIPLTPKEMQIQEVMFTK